jgi:hypothetical protein
METAKSMPDLRLRHASEGEEVTGGDDRPPFFPSGRDAQEALQARIALLLGWERRKRRESTLLVALFYAFLAALAVPLFISLPPAWAWVVPAVILAVVAPCLLFTRRWRDVDTARALAALDKRLHLDERATTAWDLSRRNETKPVALLVFREAAERLKSFDARSLFPRAWGWHAWLLLPLIALWLALLYFDAKFDVHVTAPRHVPSLARELREFARELQQKAQKEALPKTLEAARELEKLAQRAIDEGTSDEAFKSEVAAAGKRMAARRSALGQTPFAPSASRRELADLRSELEAARDALGQGEGDAQDWQDRLSGFSQLKKQPDLQQGSGRELSRGELKALVEKLEQNAAGELDRRALMEAEAQLKSMPQQAERSQRGDGQSRADGNTQRDGTAERPRDNMPGTAPGEAPGEKGEAPSGSRLPGAARGQLKGVIGEGERSSTFFKAKPAPGVSRLPQEEVVSSYQRQAESELGTERIPEELKDTIRNYFLSLEKTK